MKITKSKTKQSTDEQKKEIRSFLNDYQSINNDTTITEKAKMVLSMLLYTGNEQDKFTVGYNYIETITGISKNGISAIIGRLEKKGFISRTKGERGKNSEYTINYDTMKSYVAPSVSKCPKKVSKCTSNQVSKCTTCTPNTTCTPTCTPKSTDFQVLTNKIDELIQVSKCTSEWLEKIYNLYLNININNNINLNDNNDTTEGYNIKEHNEKEIITEDNLEILKENEILNDEIPSDLPPLNIDNFFEDEISDNENISDSDSSKNELEFSIFGNDIISDDENDNDTTVKFINGKFTVVSETEDEINSSSDVEQDNEILNDSNSSDMTMNNSSDTISNNENLSNNDNFEIWGKLQPIYGKTSNVITEYLFTEYENLNDSKNVSDGYHQVKQYISLGKEQINVSVNQTGSFGILSFKNNVYSFIACNSNIISDSSDTISERCIITPNHAAAETQNKANTDTKTSTVDNYTTTTEKTAGNSVKMANKQSNVNNSNTTVKTYTNPNPSDTKLWEYLKLRLTMKQGSYFMRDVLNEYKEMQAKNIHSVIAYMEDMCKAVRSALEKGIINEMQFNDFKRVFQTLSKGKYNYWRKVFSTREPRPNFPSEMKMWEILGKPKVTDNAETNTVDNYTTTTKTTAGNSVKMPQNASNNTVVYPNLDELYKIGYDEAIATLQKFVSEHPNLTQSQKVYFNENISAAFGIQLYDND